MSTPTISQPADELRAAAVAAEQVPVVPVVPVVAPPAEPVAATPQPFELVKTDTGVELRLETGQVYKGANEAEAIAQIAAAQVEASRTISRLSKAPEVAPVVAPPESPVLPTEAAEVLAARKFMADETAKYFGFQDADQMGAVLGRTVQTSAVTEQAAMEADFLTHNQDFPDTPEAAKALVDTLVELKLPATLDGMNAAHALSLRQGKYKALSTEQQQAKFAQAFPNQVAPPKVNAPPPMLPTSQTATSPSAQVLNPYDPKVSLADVKNWAIAAQK